MVRVRAWTNDSFSLPCPIASLVHAILVCCWRCVLKHQRGHLSGSQAAINSWISWLPASCVLLCPHPFVCCVTLSCVTTPLGQILATPNALKLVVWTAVCSQKANKISRLHGSLCEKVSLLASVCVRSLSSSGFLIWGVGTLLGKHLLYPLFRNYCFGFRFIFSLFRSFCAKKIQWCNRQNIQKSRLALKCWTWP